MAIVDRNGLPLSVSTHAASHHEVTLVQLSFDYYMIEAKPENLIGDKAYDDVAVRCGLDADLCELGAHLVNHSDARLLTDVPLFGHSSATSISQLVIPLKFI